MLVSSKDWNSLQSEQEENQTGGVSAQGLDADLARVKHLVRSAIIYQVQSTSSRKNYSSPERWKT